MDLEDRICRLENDVNEVREAAAAPVAASAPEASGTAAVDADGMMT